MTWLDVGGELTNPSDMTKGASIRASKGIQLGAATITKSFGDNSGGPPSMPQAWQMIKLRGERARRVGGSRLREFTT